jgi:endoglucanase
MKSAITMKQILFTTRRAPFLSLLGLVFSLFSPFSPTLFAADFLEIEAVSNRIVRLHFTDGQANLHTMPGGTDTYTRDTMDLLLAKTLTTYAITSANDAAYLTAKTPIRVGRKSKTGPFADIWPEYQWILKHWVYVELPLAMQEGKSYTIQFGSLAKNVTRATFIFSSKTGRTESLHVNQIGFVPASPQKFAYIYQYAGDYGDVDFSTFENKPFDVIRQSDGVVAWSGVVKFRSEKKSETNQGEASYYGSAVWECDFSAFQASGEYRISVPGVGCSFPFEIKKDVYRSAFRVSTRGFFHQRSGPDRGLPHTKWAKPVDHMPGVNGHEVYYSNFRLMDTDNQDTVFVQLPAQATNVLMPNAWGGWFDAADFDRYIEHIGITNQLCLAYESKPCKFLDGDLDIPESGNGLPDILDEARWGVDFFLRLKGPTGGISGALETSAHPASCQSWTDPLKTWYQSAEDPLASFWTAASAAQLAHCIDLADGPDSLKTYYLTAAKSAYAWAKANLQPGDLLKRNCGGQRAHAAAWLYKATGEAIFQTEYQQFTSILLATDPLNDDAIGSQFEYATWAYATAKWPSVNVSLQNIQKQASLNWANERCVDAAATRACRMGTYLWFPNIVGLGSTTPQVMPAIAAYMISGDEKYKNVVQTSADYFLGGNPLNMTWVTGLGDRSPRHVAHTASWYTDQTDPVPGIVTYGMVGPQFAGASGWWGSWSSGWNMSSYYPQFSEYAGHELYTENRYCWITNEFTVVQNMGPSAATYAFLCSEICQSSSLGQSPTAAHQDALHAFPNPFASSFTVVSKVQFPDKTIRGTLFSIDGKQLDLRYFASENLEKERFGDGLPSGVYFLELTSGDVQQRVKVVKE